MTPGDLDLARPATRCDGTVDHLVVRSDSVKTRFGDTSDKDVLVYTPAGCAGKSLPQVIYLAAFTNSGLSASNWKGFDENLLARIDRLIESEVLPPCRVVLPDSFTGLGGTQFVDSSVLGNYESFIASELLEALDAKYGVARRALVGKSSGGFGALWLGSRNPNRFSAVASLAGDVGFEWVYRCDFPKAARVLAQYEGDVEEFLRAFWSGQARRRDDFHTIMICALAASYDPEPDEQMGFVLPFDINTLQLDQDRWERWLRFDPLNWAADRAQALKALQLVHIECGDKDQYHIQFGCRRLAECLDNLEVDYTYTEFSGTHSGIDHRWDHILPAVVHAISDL